MQETKFRVGQTVWCLLYGKGKVIKIAPAGDYPVSVVVPAMNGVHELEVDYTYDGKYLVNSNRTLFFSEPKIEAATEPVFEPKLVGKVVAVYYEGSPAHAGVVTSEDNERVITQDYAWPKCSCTFHEVNPQPITFD